MKGRKPKTSDQIDKKVSHINGQIAERKEYEESTTKGLDDHLTCPSNLSPRAKTEWRRIMYLYRKMENKILNDLDRTTLAIYCEAYAEWERDRDLYEEIMSDPDSDWVVTETRCYRKSDHYRKAMNEQANIMAKYTELLALSPVGRARMGIALLNGQKKALENKKSLADLLKGDDDE